MSTDIFPVTALARAPYWSTLAAQEGYAAAHCAAPEALLALWLSQLTGPVVADQYAYALLGPPAQAALKVRGLHLLDTAHTEAVAAALSQGAALYTTTLQEPFLTVPDLEVLAELAQQRGAQLLVDTTLTPLLTRLPADSVALHRHSGLLLGHPEASGLLLSAAAPTTQAAPLPTLATLPARMRTHSGNAQAAADVLSGHPNVRAVYYPGLSTHPQFEAAADTFPGGFGGLLGLEVRHPETFKARLGQVWTEQTGYGTAHSTFSTYNPQLIHLWLGLEDIADLLSELEAALD